MRKSILLFMWVVFLSSCTTQKKLAYLNESGQQGDTSKLVSAIPLYKLQPRDILFISIQSMTPDGSIKDFLSSSANNQISSLGQGEGGGYLIGYNINTEGNVMIPLIGEIKLSGLTLEEARKVLQIESDKIFHQATVECKLLSFKYTVIGEVNSPGSFINYNNYLTVLEAIGRAGGINDFGRRDEILVVRSTEKGSITFILNLQSKRLLSSDGYYLLPNDVVIIQPENHKVFNMNLPTISFIITSVASAITTTLLLINYFKP